MLIDLATFQRNFAEALLSGAASEFDRFPGFAVYRNSSVLSAIESLERAYPTVRKLLGEAVFRDVARDYFHFRPPKSAVLAEYGAGFENLLEPLAARYRDVADMARIDRMRLESHLSCDPQEDMGLHWRALSLADWMTTSAILHPATRFHWFASPAPSLWLALQGEIMPDSPMSDNEAEGVLVTRATGETAIIRIDRALYRLLQGVAEGKRIGPTAIALAMERPGSDLGAAFRRLLESGAILHLKKEENSE
ncbi:DNA-binding domain-containing protein [Methylosinus sp. Ce-a6]|uniref:HvfC/BufC N-terminal domain-containing protein n=1 Tax=Methylosinus sp. Ce-a6 TaxID=2172005 RepID=UPI002110B121|nr:DNA-binding domain-containing protein [Methylosinus sp. Ce-a6]